MSEEIREHDQPQTDEFVEEPLTHDDKQKSVKQEITLQLTHFLFS